MVITNEIYAPKTGVYLPGVSGNYISTPDDASLDITGDICLCATVKAPDYSPGSAISLVSKYGAGGTRSYRLFVSGTGLVLTFAITVDGTAVVNYNSPNISLVDGRTYTFAVSFDADDGAGGSIATFWIDGINVGTDSDTSKVIFSGTQVLELGSLSTGTSSLMPVTFFDAKVYNGIGNNSAPGLGTLVAHFDSDKAGTRQRDSTGKIWTVAGSSWAIEKEVQR